MGGWDVRRWLGIDAPAGEQDVLDSVIETLQHLDERRARYVAGFAYLLGRVAAADHDVSAGETELMRELVAHEGALSETEADIVVRLALDEHRRFGGTHNHVVTRDLAGTTTLDERLGLLRCLFALSAADDSVELSEDNEIRRISRELRIEHGDFVRARLEVREHLAVLRRHGRRVE